MANFKLNKTYKMKNKIIVFAFLLLGLVACSSSKEDIAKKNFETSLSKQLNDPSSYEFVSIEPLRNFSKWDSIDGEILTIEKQILDEMNKSMEEMSTDMSIDTTSSDSALLK